MKILITTPVGRIGRKIVPELLAPEFSVRVITRNAGRLPSEIREQVEVVCGSTDDANVLKEALDGVDALFWCIPRASLSEVRVQAYYERFARAAALAIREAKTPRVVAISPRSSKFGVRPEEDILNESGAAIRHLRHGWLREDFIGEGNPTLQRGPVAYPTPMHMTIPMVSAEDVADVALRFLVRRDWCGVEALTIGEPGELSDCGQSQSLSGAPLHLVAANCT